MKNIVKSAFAAFGDVILLRKHNKKRLHGFGDAILLRNLVKKTPPRLQKHFFTKKPSKNRLCSFRNVFLIIKWLRSRDGGYYQVFLVKLKLRWWLLLSFL